MESRRLLVLPVVFVALTAVLTGRPGAPPALAAAPDPATAWIRPVAGRVARPFAAPRTVYGPGHRGVDLAAAPGTPVVAPGAGTVAFAGPVAGGLHVVVDHGSGLETSLSFLATIAVRRGQNVTRGQVVGTAGGTGPEHSVGVVHLGLRVRGRYVDPMRLFAAIDLPAVVHLAPVRHRPRLVGLASPAGEARELAASLHLPRGIPGLEPEPEPDLWDQAFDIGASLAGGAEVVGSALGRPVAVAWGVVAKVTPLGDAVEDLRLTASRLLAAWRARDDCTADARPAPGGGGSGHLVFAVGGIDSQSDPRTGRTFGLDTRALGYRDDEVGWFSYRPGGGPYRASHTWTDLVAQGFRLRDQLRAFARAHPDREVDLVAHSQGGVVVDTFLLVAYDPTDPTLPPMGTVVSLASPHQGAPLAEVAAALRSSPNGRRLLDAAERTLAGTLPPSGGTSTRQLAPASDLMRRLRGAPMPDQMDFTSFGGTDDGIVPDTATAKRGARSVTVNPAGGGDHSGILTDRNALRAARLALELRPPPCVGLLEGVRGAVEPVVIRRVELTLGHRVARALDPQIVPTP